MQAHLEACLPLEACGLLSGSGGLVQEVIPVRNAAQSPVRFRMDPVEQLNALEEIEAHDQELVGIFHSHPAGPEHPSPTDVAEAAYEAVYVIWSHARGAWEARAFWIEHGLISEVQLSIADGA